MAEEDGVQKRVRFDSDAKPAEENGAAVPARGRSWRTYWLALRPWSFTTSVSPVLLGAALAYRASGGQFQLLILLSSALTALSVHAAGNLVNTYFDFSLGVDSNRRWCDDRTLVDQLLTPEDVERMATVLYTLATGAYVLTALLSGGSAAFVLTLIFVLGMSGSFFYTGGGALALKYRALGELLVFTVFGPITVAFAFFAQLGGVEVGEWLWVPLLYALPLALNTVAILHANNLRDAHSEAELGGVVTVAIALGPGLSRLLLAVLLLSPYLVCAVLALHSSRAFLLPFLSAGEALKLVRVAAAVKTGRESSLRPLPQQVALLNLFLGALLIVSVLVAPQSVFSTAA